MITRMLEGDHDGACRITPGRKHVVILGGGFGGVYTALEFEKILARESSFDVTIVNRENFFLFTPMLHEVASSDLDMTNIVNPIRKLLRRVEFFHGEVASIDLEQRQIRVTHGQTHHGHTLPYDHLILGLGSVTNFYGLPGLAERALTMKTLGDAIHLRNRMIAHLEEANFECAASLRKPLLTFVVAGGGFAGVETIAGMNDFLREALPFYPHLRPEMLRLVLVHSGPVILPELGEALGRYAYKQLSARGVEIHTHTKVVELSDREVCLSDGARITSTTLVWTAGTSPNPLLATLPCQTKGGRLLVNDCLEVPGWPGVWALGDCALIPDPLTGGSHPPTGQHALREAKTAARNVFASFQGSKAYPFRFKTLGQLAAIGRRTGVARILGFNFSGVVAWSLWRFIYLSKLPRIEKKVRVVLDWMLDIVFSKDLVQFHIARGQTAPATVPSDARAMAGVGASEQ
ncbi:MAG TPA: NAD(P)/FAD-dependent oxidoreductase [Nitrospiraceae bacterium]|nr:NAD(P)/FAD-dependent oxidoreductase [Nitrospiraceae bacterium]